MFVGRNESFVIDFPRMSQHFLYYSVKMLNACTLINLLVLISRGILNLLSYAGLITSPCSTPPSQQNFCIFQYYDLTLFDLMLFQTHTFVKKYSFQCTSRGLQEKVNRTLFLFIQAVMTFINTTKHTKHCLKIIFGHISIKMYRNHYVHAFNNKNSG